MYWDQHQRADPEVSEEAEGLPMWKTVAAIVVVVACFIAVYPNMFHPLIINKFGFGNSENSYHKIPDNLPNQIPRPVITPPNRRSASSQEHSQNLHQSAGRTPFSPLPGPQMDFHHQQGSSKANWHWILPFYTIGVVVFLLYTLVKIIFKRPPRNRRQFNFHYDANRECFEINSLNDTCNKVFENVNGRNSDSAEETATNYELKRLQHRLVETESSMHKILSQLERLSASVDQSSADQLRKNTVETLKKLGEDLKNNEQQKIVEDNQEVIDSSVEEPYIRDLNKAFADFKRFTEIYLQETHSSNNSVQDEGLSTFESNVEQAGLAQDSEVEHDAAAEGFITANDGSTIDGASNEVAQRRRGIEK